MLSPLPVRRVQRPPRRHLAARPFSKMQLLLLQQQTPHALLQAETHNAHQQGAARRHSLISSSHPLEHRAGSRQRTPSQLQRVVPEHAHTSKLGAEAHHQNAIEQEGPECGCCQTNANVLPADDHDRCYGLDTDLTGKKQLAAADRTIQTNWHTSQIIAAAASCRFADDRTFEHNLVEQHNDKGTVQH